MGPKRVGRVKWFNISIGYGFITCDEDETEIFVHANSCERGYLLTGERVVFDVETDRGHKMPRSDQAVSVRSAALGDDDRVLEKPLRIVVKSQTIVC